MRRPTLLAALIPCLLIPGLLSAAPASSQEDGRILDARARYETLNLIRNDKFDLILPGAMRDNDVDMWIHVIRLGNQDPLELDLGAEFGTFVFSDRGGDRQAFGNDEYLTHNVNAWFDLNESLPGPWVDVQIGDSGPRSGTREQLRQRDPTLYALIDRFLPASLGDLMEGCVGS